MITLRTVEIEVEKDANSILTSLNWQTEKVEIGFLNFFYFFFKTNVSRQWFGQVDSGEKRFKIIRNKGQSDFGVRLSSIVSKGQIITDSNKNIIKISLQPTAYVFLNNLGLTIMTTIGILLIPLDILTENWWVVLIWTTLLLSNYIFLIIDLNKTEDKFFEYFDKQTTD